jgi:hypothetical protein
MYSGFTFTLGYQALFANLLAYGLQEKLFSSFCTRRAQNQGNLPSNFLSKLSLRSAGGEPLSPTRGESFWNES